MSDQAEDLRRIVQIRLGGGGRRPLPVSRPDRPPDGRVTLLTSGKGGVGTSVLSLNLAVALAQAGRSVILIDADLGRANLDLLAGVSPSSDLGDVLMSKSAPADALIGVIPGLRLMAGAHGLRTTDAALADAPGRVASLIADLRPSADEILIDAGTGLGPATARLAPADRVLLVATPEPTALADSHAALLRLRRAPDAPGPRLQALINGAYSAAEARDSLQHLRDDAREFLGLVLEPLGYVRHDTRVPKAVRLRRPLLLGTGGGPAAKDLRRLAADLLADPDAAPVSSARWSRRLRLSA
jgi:flagellar biosynthesis protein FlhG